jgi:lysozyme family protein
VGYVTQDDWLQHVLVREGWPTYTNRAADKGGPTKGGITYAILLAWRFRQGRTASIADLINLDLDEAKAILLAWYLEPFTWIIDGDLQALCADWAVTSGPDDPTRAIQRALDLTPDGIAGPLTRAAARTADQAALYRHVWRERLRFYVTIVLNDKDVRALMHDRPTTQLHNLRGWLNRALEMPATPDAGGGREPISSVSAGSPRAADPP